MGIRLKLGGAIRLKSLTALLVGLFLTPSCRPAAHLPGKPAASPAKRAAGVTGRISAAKGPFDLGRLSATDLFGRFYLQVKEGDGCEGYYSSLKAIEPLVRSEEWHSSVTGFYINVTEESYALRLSYFTRSPDRAQNVVERIAARLGLKHARSPELPHPSEVSGMYGHEELRFRRFLTTYTLIGLDIMKRDPLSARRLFAVFRWRVAIARKDYRAHFLRSFESLSPFYNSLSPPKKAQFWRDLALWPEKSRVDWAHLFVNMVLCGDWMGEEWLDRFRARKPLSILEINRVLKSSGIGFEIPEGWRP